MNDKFFTTNLDINWQTLIVGMIAIQLMTQFVIIMMFVFSGRSQESLPNESTPTSNSGSQLVRSDCVDVADCEVR